MEASGVWREIAEPDNVDSLGKLNEWLAGCGMPQRDCTLSEIDTKACQEAEIWNLGTIFPSDDRAAATEHHKALVSFAAASFYARFSNMGGQRLVWRVRPQVGEAIWANPSIVDGRPSTPGERRAEFYARFWLEAE